TAHCAPRERPTVRPPRLIFKLRREAGEDDAWCCGGLDEQFLASDSKMASLLGAVPLLAPGPINTCDKVLAFDAKNQVRSMGCWRCLDHCSRVGRGRNVDGRRLTSPSHW